MHFCAQEILLIALITNAAQAGFHVYLFQKVTQARALAQKFRDEVRARPVKTIIYGSKDGK